MKALTIRQPWASLIAVGAKTIETRSWPTKHRGRIAIHAGMREPEIGLRLGAWRTLVAEYQPCIQIPGNFARPMPLGAIVATAELVDCVPIISEMALADAPYMREDGMLRLADVGDGGDALDRREQLPFGDFMPGRFAWLLAAVRPVTECCPVCARGRVCVAPDCAETCTLERGHRNVVTCPVCDGAQRCDPIPVRGRQGLWTWDWRALAGENGREQDRA